MIIVRYFSDLKAEMKLKYAQKYSIDTVAKIRKKIEEVTVLLQVPVKWSDAIVRWLYDAPENQQWLFDHRLSSGRYSYT